MFRKLNDCNESCQVINHSHTASEAYPSREDVRELGLSPLDRQHEGLVMYKKKMEIEKQATSTAIAQSGLPVRFIMVSSLIAVEIAFAFHRPAWAQEASGTAAEEEVRTLPTIIVTADKTEEDLDRVPASIAVIDGQDIEQSGISSLKELEGRVPGLSFQPFGQAGMNSPVMRGLTANFNTFSTSTLLLVDGVPTLTAQGFENSMIDLDRIEVMRGPQSTLYGRNAEAGVIAIHSLPMDNTPRASISGEAGSHNNRAMNFSFSRPIVEDALYASISGNWSKQDGFIDNTNTGHKEDGRERRNINLGLRWTPSEQTDLTLRFAGQEYDDGASLWGAPSARRAHVASGTAGWNRSHGQTFSLSASHEFASGLHLNSITAYNDFRDKIQQDTDFRPQNVMYVKRNNHLRTLSQELRLEGTLGDSTWLIGAYADRGDNDLESVSKSPMGLDNIVADQKSYTTALFTHWNIPLSSHWSIAAGARVERNEVKFEPHNAVSQKKSWTHISPKLALQYQISAEHQWYASVSRGIRTGGFNVLAPKLDYLSYEPEKTWSYEIGVKGWLMDRRVHYSFAAYVMNIGDMQVMQMPTAGVMYITSAATATSKGIELDVDYLLGYGWQLKAGLAWNHTRFDRFRDGGANYQDKHNPFAPDLNGYFGIQYDAPEGWYAQANLVGSSKVYLDAANQYKRNGYGLINMTAGYQYDKWEVTAYVNNLADKRYDAVGYQNGFVTVYSPPRELGLRLTWRY